MASDALNITELSEEVLRKMSRALRLGRAGEAEEGALLTGRAMDMDRVIRWVRSVARAQKHDEQVVDLLLEDVEPQVMGEEHLRQLRLQAAARARFLEEVPLLTSQAVGELLGSEARNTSAMASRLKREGRLFAVTHKGTDLYPSFQVVEGEAHPAIRDVLAAFQAESPWTVALWFFTPSGWLGGERPMDLLAREPERVIEAARQTSEPLAV